jgi:hypothetical protein
MIRHYFIEYLSDGEERSIDDILKYVIQKNGELGVNGDTVGYRRVYNALYAFLRSGESGYVIPRRGWFAKEKATEDEAPIAGAGVNDASASELMYNNALWILRAAEIGIRNCFASCLSAIDIFDETAFDLREAERDVIYLLEWASRIISDAKICQRKGCTSAEDARDNNEEEARHE